MNRYEYALKKSQSSSMVIGLFPYGTIIDIEHTDIKNEQLTLLDSGVVFLKKLVEKKIEVILFINQFKQRPASFDDLKKFTEAVEGVVRQHGVNVGGMYWAPGYDKKDPFVVPNPGMFYRVTENTGMKWTNISVLSSFDDDLSAANKVNATPIKIGESHSRWDAYSSPIAWIDKQ